MRLLHYAAIVLRIVDAYTGEVLRNAVAQCLNRQTAGIRNHEGHCLFSNLPLGTYEFEVSCVGYCIQHIQVAFLQLDAPQMITVRLAYCQTHPQLRQIPHRLLLLRTEQGVLAHTDLTLCMKSQAPLLRVIAPAAKGNTVLALSGAGKVSFLQREFRTEQGEPLVLRGFADEQNQYTLAEPLKKAIKTGSSLCPIWNFKTDDEGACILPIERLLMNREEAAFVVECAEKRREIIIQLHGNEPQTVCIEI